MLQHVVVRRISIWLFPAIFVAFVSALWYPLPTFSEESGNDALDNAVALDFGADTPEGKEEAKNAYRSLLEIDPTNLIASNNLALLLIEDRLFEEAEELFSNALDADTESEKGDKIAFMSVKRKANGELAVFYKVQPVRNHPINIVDIVRKNFQELTK
jgi:tetratricopeptide (TPR) repeat protein